MTEKPVPELITSVLRRYFQVEVFTSDWQESLKRELNNPKFPDRASQFREQLAEAILHRTITPKQYEELTDEEFDTPEALEEWLRELWRDFYGDEPISARCGD